MNWTPNLWDKVDLIMVDEIFDVLLDLSCQYLLSIFASMLMSDLVGDSLSWLSHFVILVSG